MLLLNKTLIKLAQHLWGWIIAIVGVSFLILAGTTALAEIIGNFLGSLFEPQEILQSIWQAIGLAFITVVLTFMAQLLKGVLEYQTATKARKDLRKKIFSKVMELDAVDIEKIGPVSAITASVDAVEQIQTYYSVYLPSLIYSIIAPVYLFFHLKDIALLPAVLLLVTSLILLPLNNFFRSRIESLRDRYWYVLEDLTAYYMDSLHGLTTLKLFGRDREHAHILGKKAECLNQSINHFQKINFTSFLVTEALIYTAVILVIADTAFCLIKGNINISNALIVLMLAYSYFSSARQLMNASHTALTAISAAGKVEEIMSMDTTRLWNPQLPEATIPFDGIRMEKVSYAYPGRNDAVSNISIDIPRGSTTAFVGLSGCGKSTLASLLMRFCDPYSGRILINGKDYISCKPEDLRKNIVMVPQQVNLFSGSIRENLLIAAPQADDLALMAVLEEAGLAPFVRSLKNGLDSEVGNRGTAFSGGQRQKIGIARALLSKAEFMIFDEATSSVDPESEQEIRETIRQLSQTHTLIIISHRMSSIRNADNIYVLCKGEVIEKGNHDELIQKDGLYRKLVMRQRIMEDDAN